MPKENPFKHDDKFGGLNNLKPSVKLRLAQGIIDTLRDNLANYGRVYLNYDYRIKEEGGLGISWAPLVFDFKYNNLKHLPIQIDMQSFIFNFTTSQQD